MKQLAKNLVIVGAMVAAGSAGADMFSDVGFNPVIGVDYYQAWMRGKDQADNSFSKIFPKSYPGITLYVSNKFTENFGLELGFDGSTRSKKDWTVVVAGNTNVGKSKIRKIGGHLDLIGYLPIVDCANLFASVGWGYIKPSINVRTTSINGVAYADPATDFKGKGKSVLRLDVGADWMATDMFGLRAKLGWETTSALRVQENDTANNVFGPKFKAFKDSITLAAGVFVKF